MNHQPVSSSQLYSVAYSPETQTMEIRFKDRKTGLPGSLYEYYQVPAFVHTELMAAESVGNYFSQNIKTNFQYKKIS